MERKQDILNHSQNPLSTISFRRKSSALSLVITGSAAGYYVANMWPMRPAALANDIIPAGYGNLVLGTIALFVLAQIVLQVVLLFGSGSAPAATARERAALLKASRNAYAVLTVGVFAAIGSVFLEALTPFCTANIAILGFTLAEIVKFSSQLVYGGK